LVSAWRLNCNTVPAFVCCKKIKWIVEIAFQIGVYSAVQNSFLGAHALSTSVAPEEASIAPCRPHTPYRLFAAMAP
jgi:hypothetical protein